MKNRVVIVDDEPIFRMDIAELLQQAGYDVVGEAADGFDAIELCRKYKPDLVLMDIKMPLFDGIKAVKTIYKEGLSGSVVIITAYNDKEYIDMAKEAGAMGYLVKPINEKILIPTIEMAIAKGKEIQTFKEDLRNMQIKYEERKVIERAKGIWMTEYHISEEEAYRRMQCTSMSKRCSMAEIAKYVISN